MYLRQSYFILPFFCDTTQQQLHNRAPRYKKIYAFSSKSENFVHSILLEKNS